MKVGPDILFLDIRFFVYRPSIYEYSEDKKDFNNYTLYNENLKNYSILLEYVLKSEHHSCYYISIRQRVKAIKKQIIIRLTSISIIEN